MKRSIPLLFAVFFSFLGCQTSEEARIHRTLVQREEAFRNKDLSLYLSCISSAYQDKEENFEQLKGRVGRYLDVFDRIEYTSWNRSIRIEGEAATVTQEFVLEVEKEGRRKRYAGKEILSLRKERGEWKIIKGL